MKINKNQLKEILKPVIKEAVQEVVKDQLVEMVLKGDLISHVISEVVKGTNSVPQINETTYRQLNQQNAVQQPPQSVPTTPGREATSYDPAALRRKMLEQRNIQEQKFRQQMKQIGAASGVAGVFDDYVMQEGAIPDEGDVVDLTGLSEAEAVQVASKHATAQVDPNNTGGIPLQTIFGLAKRDRPWNFKKN